MSDTGSRTESWFGQPRGLSVLFFTEMWERFSYYGMRAILMFFMVAPAAGGGLGFGVPRAGLVYGTYTLCVYLLAIPGGFIGDRFLGARRSVFLAGLLIALGHFSLAFAAHGTFFLGLGLIAAGSGLLKPNMSAMVGGLYAPDDVRRDSGFALFYLGINLGAFIAPLVTGFLAQSRAWRNFLVSRGLNPAESWHWGFAAAGVGMSFGLVIFVWRRRAIARVGLPPEPGRARPWRKLAGLLGGVALFLGFVFLSDRPGWEWMRSGFIIAPVSAILLLGFRPSLDGRRMAAVLVLFLAALAFWSLFEQAGTTIALFSDRLTRSELLGFSFPSAWFQSLNSLFVILLSPVFAWLWVAWGPRQPSSPVKFVLGLFFLSLAFALMVPAARLTASGRVSPFWLVGLFFLETIGELCLSPVGLSAMTKLAPGKWAGLVLGIWFLADALGNKFAGVLAGHFTPTDPGALAASFLRQALLVGACALALLALTPWVKRLMGGVK